MLTTPILQPISTFDATNDRTITFNIIGGDQVFAHDLEIQLASNNTTVYSEQRISFLFTHILLANSLTNGNQYRARVRTYDSGYQTPTTPSNWSEWVMFYVFSTPVVGITNFSDPIKNQHYTFQGSYTQTESDPIQSYRYFLYDSNQQLITTSAIKYDELLEHEFIGFEDGYTYNVELRVISQYGIEGSSGLLSFTAQYFQPRLATVIGLENNPINGTVMVTANVIRIIGEITEGTISYEADEWVDLTNGEIAFDDAFDTEQDFTLELWIKNITPDLNFLVIKGQQGRITLQYSNEKVRATKRIDSTNTVLPTFASADILIGQSDTVYICMKHINNLIDINVEVLA